MKESLKRSWKLTACRVIATFLVALVSLTSMAGIWRSSAQSSTCNYTQIPSAEGVVNISPDISADGNRVAYLSFDFSNILLGWQVRLYDASTGTSQQISGSGLPGALYPAISADGNRIAYQGCCEGTAQTPIYLYDSSTQTTTQISGANSEGAYPVLNANGSRVVYVTSVGPAGPRVVL